MDPDLCLKSTSPGHGHESVARCTHSRGEQKHGDSARHSYPCIVILGGYNPVNKSLESAQAVTLFNSCSNQWCRMGVMPEPRHYHAAVAFKSCIHVFGGVNPSCDVVTNTNFRLCLWTGNWGITSAMCVPRAYHSATAISDHEALVCGGVDANYTILCSADVYNCNTDQWTSVRPMPLPLMGAGTVPLGDGVLVGGGVTRCCQQVQIVDQVFKYSPFEDTWSLYTPLPFPVAFPALVELNHNPWLLGGYNTKSLSRCFEHSSYSRCWRMRAEMCPPRHAAASATIHETTFLVGGMNSLERSPLDLVTLVRPKGLSEGPRYLWPVTGAAAVVLRRPVSNQTQTKSHKCASRFCLGKPAAWCCKTSPPVSVKGWPPFSGGVTCVPSCPPAFTSLARPNDPNLGIMSYLDRVTCSTRDQLGLRKVDEMPKAIQDLCRTNHLREECEPAIVLFGGIDPRDPTNSKIGSLVLRYMPLKDSYELFGEMPVPRNHHAAAIVGSTIYLTGGYDINCTRWGEMVATGTTLSLCLNTHKWEVMQSMSQARAHHAMVAAHGCLLVFGGRDDCGRFLASCEQFDGRCWRPMASMPSPLMGQAAALCREQVWLLGGIRLDDPACSSGPICDNILCFDIQTGQWSESPCRLRCPRAFASAVVVGDQLWVIGGCLGSEELVSVAAIDRLCPSRGVWRRESTMMWPRHCAAVIPVETCVYCFGGMTSQQWRTLSKTEMFMATEGRQHMCHDLPVELTGCAGVSIAPIKRIMRERSFCVMVSRHLNL